MTTNKDFKRLVRGRMQKTGESYTAARFHLVKKAALTAPADYARVAGMADDKLKAKTGCTWERWVWALDRVKAHQWPHREIAQYVHEKYKVDGWWSQMVTVGYERIKGLRERGRRLSGHYEATKSRTLPVSVSKVFKAWSQPRLRSQWLPDVTVVVRGATANKSIRITWEDGTSVQGWFISKGRSKAQVALAHGKLPNRETAERLKGYWAERLEALEAMLAPARNGKS